MAELNEIDDLEKVLRERFKLEQFRPGQREVIAQVVAGRDVLCVMPTGGGKSLCYQLPALLLPGLTLVVSPLIALMKDQVDVLQARGIRATLINSTLDPTEQASRIREIEAGQFDLVYVAPERFRSSRFVEAMRRIKPALLAVDEAHCISEWGHDFRPDYARLSQARKALGMPPCIALTATATDLVRRDIADLLDLRDPSVFVTGFDRPNLSYRVVATKKELDKLEALAATLDRNPGSAIIYASSRKRCEEVCGFLKRDLRRDAVLYHAGLTREERHEAQNRFMSGSAEIVVATNAFGMGVDKSNIRTVVHYNIPGTLEAYYQEAGRAGRDGEPAECVLFFAQGDRFLQEFFIENEYPPSPLVFKVYEYLRTLDADPIELTQSEIKEAIGSELSDQAVGTALRLLEGAGAPERFRPRENMAIVRINVEEPSLVDRLGTKAQVQRLVMTAVEGLVNRRYNEPIYFLPDELASAIGLDRLALTRALRAICDDLPVDYVPPFRGNAIRINDRQCRSRDLQIDFSALQKRKDQEYDKLERMLKYAQTKSCRRAFVLSYFGDTKAASTHCGRCDNCNRLHPAVDSNQARPIKTPAGVEVILKVLSGVARAKGRFGKVVVAQMLTGSGSEKMDRWGLRRLSTFNILADFKQPEVIQIIDSLAQAGLLAAQEVDRFRPVIDLTEAGWELVRNSKNVSLALELPADLIAKIQIGGLRRLPSRSEAEPVTRPESIWEPAAHPTETSPAELKESPSGNGTMEGGDLREGLRQLRLKLARESNLSPAYVFSNETLDALVRERPSSPHQLSSIKGIGPSKLERFGTAILAAIREGGSVSTDRSAKSVLPVVTSEPSDQAVASSKVKSVSRPADLVSPSPREVEGPPASEGYVATEEWTFRLIEKGFTIQETAAIRSLEQTAIVRHLLWSARQGKRVAVEAFLDVETAARWRDRRDHQDGDQPPDDSQIDQSLWALFLLCDDAP